MNLSLLKDRLLSAKHLGMENMPPLYKKEDYLQFYGPKESGVKTGSQRGRA